MHTRLFVLASLFSDAAQQPDWFRIVNLLWGATSLGLNLFLSEQQLRTLSQKAQSNSLVPADLSLIRVGMHRLVSVLSDLKRSMPMLEKAIPLSNQLG
jgi:hypothetical protein